MRPGAHRPVLACYPTSRGIGYALLDRERRLVDWGTKGIRGRGKNVQSLHAVTALIERHHPARVVLEDVTVRGTRRHTRIRALHESIVKYAKANGYRVRRYSRNDVYTYFNVRTKHELAVTIAQALPALQIRIPPKRKPWMSEDARQSLFDAAALALRALASLEGVPPHGGTHTIT